MLNKTDATDAFCVRVDGIRSMLAKLNEAVESHFGIDPDDVNWGHVGSLAAVTAALKVALAHAPGV